MNFDNLLGVETKTLSKRWDIDENYIYDYVTRNLFCNKPVFETEREIVWFLF